MTKFYPRGTSCSACYSERSVMLHWLHSLIKSFIITPVIYNINLKKMRRDKGLNYENLIGCLNPFQMVLRWNEMLLNYRSSRQEVFYKKSVLRNFAKFTGKHLCQSLFLIKLQADRQVFSCDFCEISKNTFSYWTPTVAASEIKWKDNESIFWISQEKILLRSRLKLIFHWNIQPFIFLKSYYSNESLK